MDSRREINGVDDRMGTHGGELPLGELLESWRPRLERADRELRRFVRRNPLAALATVTLAGFLLGRLLRRHP